MKDPDILAHLAVLCSPQTDNDTFNRTLLQLLNAAPQADSDGLNPEEFAFEDGRCNVIRTTLSSLVVSARVEGHTKHLPQLFPVFALYCGDREPDSFYGEIDWAMLDFIKTGAT